MSHFDRTTINLKNSFFLHHLAYHAPEMLAIFLLSDVSILILLSFQAMIKFRWKKYALLHIHVSFSLKLKKLNH